MIRVWCLGSEGIWENKVKGDDSLYNKDNDLLFDLPVN